MSLLPTAHAGQSFGSRRIDFFTVSGQVTQSEASSGHLKDHDGIDHEVRLMEQTSALAPGDTATVLRVQSGPNRRSRPVAIVNHSRGVWMRASPDATTLLSRSGVTRTLNWMLSILLLVLTAAAAVWPVLHTFLTEISGSMMASVPLFDIFSDVAARWPNLSAWRLESALPAGILDALRGLGFVPMDQLTEIGLGLTAAILAFIAFGARSWRLIYVPAFAGLTLLSGAILGGPDASLIMIAGAIALFFFGGFINRVRDGGRFNARVDRLADHVLRHPPQESVSVAAAVSDGASADEQPANDQAANDPAPAGDAEAPPLESAPAEEPAAEDGGKDDGILPAAAATAAIASAAALAEGEDSANAASGEDNDEAEAEAEGLIAAPSETMAESGVQTDQADTPDTDEAQPAAVQDAPDAAEASNPNVENAPDQIDADIIDDDLPSLEETEAAAALSAAEDAGEDVRTDAEAPPTDQLEDERTMPVAAPPPLPEEPAAEGSAEPVEAEAAPEQTELVTDAEAEAESGEEVADSAETVSGGAADPEPAMSVESAPADDVLIEDDNDPMLPKAEAGDLAPGAPDIEVDKD